MTAAYQNTIPLSDEQQFALTTEGRKQSAAEARRRILARVETRIMERQAELNRPVGEAAYGQALNICYMRY